MGGFGDTAQSDHHLCLVPSWGDGGRPKSLDPSCLQCPCVLTGPESAPCVLGLKVTCARPPQAHLPQTSYYDCSAAGVSAPSCLLLQKLRPTRACQDAGAGWGPSCRAARPWEGPPTPRTVSRRKPVQLPVLALQAPTPGRPGRSGPVFRQLCVRFPYGD